MKIWILGMLLAVSFCVGCGLKSKLDPPATSGSGVTKTDSRNIAGFKKINAASAIDVTVSITNGYSVVVKADEEVIANVITKLDGDTLVLSLKDNTNSKSKINI